VITEETELKVLLAASLIPDGSDVSKRTGEQVYTLKKNLTVYSDTEGKSPVVMEGFFLVGPRGSINQVSGDKLLHWIIPAGSFVAVLQIEWEPDQ
jgi:hypothetical protein